MATAPEAMARWTLIISSHDSLASLDTNPAPGTEQSSQIAVKEEDAVFVSGTGLESLGFESIAHVYDT